MVQDDKGKPLAGANVILKNTVLGAATDDQGNYIIHKIPVSYTHLTLPTILLV